MVGHVRIFHPDNLLCWVCGLAFNTSEGKVIIIIYALQIIIDLSNKRSYSFYNSVKD